jgi:hypothetical protein
MGPSLQTLLNFVKLSIVPNLKASDNDDTNNTSCTAAQKNTITEAMQSASTHQILEAVTLHLLRRECAHLKWTVTCVLYRLADTRNLSSPWLSPQAFTTDG